MVMNGWASMTSALNRSMKWPVDHVCLSLVRADAATSPFQSECLVSWSRHGACEQILQKVGHLFPAPLSAVESIN